MLHLPVSGMAVNFSMPDGNDDLAIIEAQGPAVVRALAIVPRLARIIPDSGGGDGTADNWAELTVTDFEFALLALRMQLVGERIACAFDCPHSSCGERVEVEFPVADFLGDVHPTLPRGVRADDGRPGWFRLADATVSFRLPTVSDQAAVAGRPDATQRLRRICIDPPDLPVRTSARVERAMEHLAPEVSREITGTCPGCGNTLSATLYVPHLVIDELQRATGGVHEDIHLIASAYHWREAEILALPRVRRQNYAEHIRRYRHASA